MNDSEQFDDLPQTKVSDSGNLKAQFENFQNLFLTTLVALVIFSLSWNVFLIRQTAFLRNDLKAVRPQIGMLVENYQKTEGPQIKSFVDSLVDFGKKNPDFNPILTKYKIPVAQAAAPAKK